MSPKIRYCRASLEFGSPTVHAPSPALVKEMPGWLRFREEIQTYNLDPEAAARYVLLGVLLEGAPLGEGGSIPVRDIGTRLGISILELDLNVSGYVERKDTQATIGVRRKDVLTRQRFTIARNLGHLFLHDFDILLRKSGADPAGIDREANCFAAELLMPVSRFTHHARCSGNNVESLADQYKVSTEAVKYRLLSLGV